MNLVQIEWADSRRPTSEWFRASELPAFEFCRCVSVGFLIQDDENIKVLAANVADLADNDMQATGVIVIPTVAVLKQTALTSCSSPESKPKRRRF